MRRVVTYGEVMLRLSPPGFKRLIQADSFDATYGGGEVNVAVSLAQLGVETAHVSAVPDNSLGEAAVNHLRRFGVDARHVKRCGERLGLYFVEHGASHRPLQVLYDRKNTAIAQVAPGTFEWAEILEGAAWFHCTSITPALSDNTARETLEACRAAKAAEATVSCDLGYREALWPQDKARAVMTDIVPHVDVLMASLPAIDKILGVAPRTKVGAAAPGSGVPSDEACEDVARQLEARFGLTHVAITRRQTLSAFDNRWSAVLHVGQRLHRSQSYEVHMVDRVGAGDAFAAGLIYCLLAGMEPARAVDFATAASCLKHSIPGDANMVRAEEAWQLIQDHATGRIGR